ncbi:MAG: tetratricopeptide repeat protein [Myxococcota bacterium]
MESVAVIQLSAVEQYGYEGPVSRVMSALLSGRLGRIGPIHTTHIEVSPTDRGSEVTWPALDSEQVLDAVSVKRLMLDIKARHWLTGWVTFDEDQQELTLDLELTTPQEPEQIWEGSFTCEMDEVADAMNRAAVAVAHQILTPEQVEPEVLWVETRSFEAFRCYCHALDTQDDAQARHLLEEACGIDPYFSDALGELALDALLSNAQTRFEALCSDLLRATHLRPSSMVEQLHKLEQGGFYDEALSLAVVSAHLNPGRLELMRSLSRLAMFVDREASFGAVELLVSQGALERQDSALLARLSMLYRLCGDERRSERTAHRLLGLGPGGHRAMGRAALEMGDLVLACEYLEATLKQSPGDTAVLGDLAGAYIQMARFDEAARLLEVHHDRNAVLDSNLALALRHMGRLDEAEQAARKAVDCDPTHPQAWAVLGELRRAVGDLEEAHAAFRAAMAVDPDNLVWHLELGRVLFHMGHFDEAMALFARVVERQPELAQITPEVLFVMAQITEREQGIEAALPMLYRALELEPGFWQAANNLAVLLMRLGRHTEAEALLLNALELDPDNDGIHANLARARKDRDET